MRNPLAIFLRTNTAGRAALLRRLVGPGPAWTVLAALTAFWVLALSGVMRPTGMDDPMNAMLWMYAALGAVIATLFLFPAALAVLAVTYVRRARAR